MRALSPAERMKGRRAARSREIEVPRAELVGVNVYMRCQQTLLSGMSGGAFSGSRRRSARGCIHAARACAKRPDVIDTAQALAGMVAKIENDRAESRARAARSRAAKG